MSRKSCSSHRSIQRNRKRPLSTALPIAAQVSSTLRPATDREWASKAPKFSNCWYSAEIAAGSVSVSPPRAWQRRIASARSGRSTM
ncbi:hypothetical protein G6F32_015914 [Rhizopus arrhizus]|nr:hypothetical protein G6F32_015914 [Rhizopus arrhizus]